MFWLQIHAKQQKRENWSKHNPHDIITNTALNKQHPASWLMIIKKLRGRQVKQEPNSCSDKKVVLLVWSTFDNAEFASWLRSKQQLVDGPGWVVRRNPPPVGWEWGPPEGPGWRLSVDCCTGWVLSLWLHEHERVNIEGREECLVGDLER